MTLTQEQSTQFDIYLRMPWTLLPSKNEEDGYHVLRVKELPEVLATGRDETELAADFWESMRAALRARLVDGEAIPLPLGYKPVRSPVRVMRANEVSPEGPLWVKFEPATAGGLAPVLAED